jgi:phosphate transport system substrate-binding protein
MMRALEVLFIGLLTTLLPGCAYWFDHDYGKQPAPAAPHKEVAQAADDTSNNDENVIRLRGSSTIGSALAPRIVSAFLSDANATEIVTKEGKKEENRTVVTAKLSGKPVTFMIQFPGSSAAFDCLANDTCDIGMSSRPISEEEVAHLESAADMTHDESEHVLAMDGIAVVVNRTNAVQKLTVKEVGAIFRHEITNWSQVGGTNAEIHLVSRDKGSGTYQSFVELALAGKDVPLDKARVVLDNEAIAASVKQDAAAIGFVGLPYVGETRALAIQDGEAVPMGPTPFSVATEEYAFSRRLFFYTAQAPKKALARKLVEFAISDAGQAVIAQTGFVALDIRAAQAQLPVGAPEAYAKAVTGAQRLSFDFRFKGTTNKLDPRSVHDVDRLARFLRVASSKARAVSLFGFTDGPAADSKSVELSKQRAGTIATLLRDRGIAPQVVEGFGGLMPLASNESAEGRRKNRRVEVWVK